MNKNQNNQERYDWVQLINMIQNLNSERTPKSVTTDIKDTNWEGRVV